jgi:hypothetical protein
MDVREAARRTIETGSARVSTRTFFDPPPSRLLLRAMETTAEGVVDLTRRRARLETLLSPAVERLTERVLTRWPWLDDDEEDVEEAGFDTVFDAGRRYVAGGPRWALVDDGGSAPKPEHPTWILDALAGATGAHHVADEDVRGARCERYALDAVDLRAAAANGAIVLPPHGSVERPTLRGDAWIDGEGLVRRVTWIQPLRGRRRLRPSQANPKLWRSTELWDFGLAVEIDVPDPQPRTEPMPLRRVASDLWRMRADYRRKHRAG